MTDKFTRCPDCGHKSVYLQPKRNGEDNYRCRMPSCDFYFFTNGGSTLDTDEQRWLAVNPAVHSENAAQ